MAVYGQNADLPSRVGDGITDGSYVSGDKVKDWLGGEVRKMKSQMTELSSGELCLSFAADKYFSTCFSWGATTAEKLMGTKV